jgi:hypothetical protein
MCNLMLLCPDATPLSFVQVSRFELCHGLMQDNEDDKSEPRIKEWVKQLKDEGIN